MGRAELEQYIRQDVQVPEEMAREMPKVTSPALQLKSDQNFGNKNFRLGWCPVTTPWVMEKEPHRHDIDQFLLFIGGDLTNMVDLGGEVELTLSEDGINLETFLFTRATWVFVPKGLYHCPLNFKKINDPKKPILFHDFFFNTEYWKI